MDLPRDSLYPKHSMYGICTYIETQNHPNVGVYGIHGVSGYDIYLPTLVWFEGSMVYMTDMESGL